MIKRRRDIPPGFHGRLINSNDAALHFLWTYRITIQPATVRQWAARGKIGSYGTGRECYILQEIETYAASLKLIPDPAE